MSDGPATARHARDTPSPATPRTASRETPRAATEAATKAATKAATRAALGRPDEATLQRLMAAALRHVDVERLGVGSGTAGALSIGRITLEEASAGRVVLAGLSTRVRCGSAVLHDVRAILELGFTAHWRYDLKWLGSDSGVKALGSKANRVELHDIRLPMLQDFVFEIPEAVAEDVEATLEPIENLELGGSRLADVRAEGTRLPTDGFALDGLDLGTLEITAVTVPGATTRRLGIGELEPEGPLQLPGLDVRGIEVPALGIADVSSAGAVSLVGAALEPIEAPLFKLGELFAVRLVVEPVLHLQIGELVLSELEASAAIESAGVRDLAASVAIGDVAVDELALADIALSRVET